MSILCNFLHNGNAAVVKLLLKYDADPNVPATEKLVPAIWVAAQNGHLDVSTCRNALNTFNWKTNYLLFKCLII